MIQQNQIINACSSFQPVKLIRYNDLKRFVKPFFKKCVLQFRIICKRV